MKSVNEILDQRGRVIEQMRALQTASPEGLSTEEQAKYDAMNSDQEALKARADDLVELEKISAETASFSKPAVKPTTDKAAAMDAYLRKGTISNALSVGTDSAGGYLVSDEFDMRFREKRDWINNFRTYAEVITTGGDHNIRVEAGIPTASWMAEAATYSESDPSFGNVVLNAYKLGVIVKASEELVQDDDFDLEAYLSSAIGRAVGIAEETAFVVGTGTGQPTGLTVDAGDVGSTETAITADAIMDLFYGLAPQYRADGTFVFNDSTIRQIRGITDTTDQFIWQPGLQAGEPDRILGRPFVNSDAMPETTDGVEAVIGLFGDLRNYAVGDRKGLSVQRLDELYAANGQVGYRAYVRLDAKTTQAEGIKSLILA